MEPVFLIPVTPDQFKKLVSDCVTDAISKAKENETPRKYTMGEAADYLGVSLPTIHNYKKRRLLKFNQVGRKVWILEPELNRFLTEKQK